MAKLNKKARHQLRRKEKKLAAKRAKRTLYLAQAASGKQKGSHQNKRLDPNRYGKIAEKCRRAAGNIINAA